MAEDPDSSYGGSTGATSRLISRPPPRKPAATMIATTSRQQQLLVAFVPPHGKYVVPQPPTPLLPQPHDGTHEDDDELVNVDDFINTGAAKGLYMPSVDEEPFAARDDHQAGRPNTCTQRLVFHGLSQETPPAADPPQEKQGLVFSPNTLRKATDEQMAVADTIVKKKHYRKRGNNNNKKGVSQPLPKRIRDQDTVVVPSTQFGLP